MKITPINTRFVAGIENLDVRNRRHRDTRWSELLETVISRRVRIYEHLLR